MEINVIDDKKIVTVWLTRADQENSVLLERLNSFYKDCKSKKYMVVQFNSGTKDLYECTHNLLLYNRRRFAELEVQRKKQKRGIT